MKKRVSAVIRVIALVCLAALLCGCGSGRQTKEVEMTAIGVDVARYQGTIDWQKLADSGIDFAIVRVGFRGMSDGEINEDPNGRYNLQEAAKADIPLGVYFFSTATTEEEAKEEAAWVAAIISQYPITYPVAYDCENYKDPSSRQYGMGAEQRTDVALAFLRTIEELGYEGMFYSSKNELDANWETERIARDYKIWVAQYPEEPYPATECSTYWDTHHIWQYSKDGHLPGIDQPVDMNVAYFGYDGIEPAKSKTPPEEVEPNLEAMMDFTPVREMVTAKEKTNLRASPDQEAENILFTVWNGEWVERVAVSPSGWSKLSYKGQTCYALTNYLTTDVHYDPDSAPRQRQDTDGDGVVTPFEEVNDRVTPKEAVNLRTLPSVDHPDCVVRVKIKHGDVVTRTGINRDLGWSRVVYNGETLYCISSYLTEAE